MEYDDYGYEIIDVESKITIKKQLFHKLLFYYPKDVFQTVISLFIFILLFL